MFLQWYYSYDMPECFNKFMHAVICCDSRFVLQLCLHVTRVHSVFVLTLIVSSSSMELESENATIYDEVRRYLLDETYPEGARKSDKAVIRKRSKRFQVLDGCLMYKDSRDGQSILRQVSQQRVQHYLFTGIPDL